MQVKKKFIGEEMATDSEVASAIDSKVQTLKARISVQLTPGSAASSSTFTKVGQRYIWIQSRNSSYKNAILIYRTTITAYHIQVRVVNTTTGAVLATSAMHSQNGVVFTLPFNVPTADCSIEIQVARGTNVTTGSNPLINDVVFEFDTI